MIVGGQTLARDQLSSTIIDYHEPFDQGLTSLTGKEAPSIKRNRLQVVTKIGLGLSEIKRNLG